MTPIEKLVSDLKKFCANHGSYGREERGAVQLILGEYESAPKPWTPTWSLKVPDWATWLVVDPETGRGNWFGLEPIESTRDKRYICQPNSLWKPAGYFEIQAGADWRTMKIQVKKDGVLIGG